MVRIRGVVAAGLVWLALMVPVNAGTLAPPEESRSPSRWSKRIVQISFSTSLLKPTPAIKDESDVVGAVKASLATWESACDIKFQVGWTERGSVSPAAPAGDGVSLVTISQTPDNLVLFGGDSLEVSARTRVFTNRRGQITEADIVLNPYQQFSTDGSFGTFDLEATLTHEIGHLLGLSHSAVYGASMFEHQAKNGVFGLPGVTPRTLSGDDLAAIRGLYGTTDDGCCGSISGRISTATASAKHFIWVQEQESGRVAASRVTETAGDFRFDGLEAGRYVLFAQRNDRQGSGERLGVVEVANGKTMVFDAKGPLESTVFTLDLIGFNGQMSRVPVLVNAGRTFTVYIAGKALEPEGLEIEVDSPWLSVVPGTLADRGGASGSRVMSFDVRVETGAPEGDYTLAVKSRSGAKKFMVGSLTVEKQLNPWSVFDRD